MDVKLIGYVAGLCFVSAAIPQAIASIKHNRHLGTPLSIIITIFIGIVLMYVYMLMTTAWNLTIFLVHLIEACSWGTLLFYHVRDKGWKEHVEL